HQLRLDGLDVGFLQTRRHGGHRSMISPDRRAKRTLRPSTILKPTLVGFLSLGSASDRFDAWIGFSFSTMPPVWPGRGLVWRLTPLTPWTSARFSSGNTRSTSPDLPLSRPVRTTTVSPLRIFILTRSAASITGPPAPG